MPIGVVAADLDRSLSPDLVTANALTGDVSMLVNQRVGEPLCTGDCNDSGTVGVDEMVRSVGVALGRLTPADRLAADRDGNAAVSINELIDAVRNALDGC